MMLLITNVLDHTETYPEMNAAVGNGSYAPAPIIPDAAKLFSFLKQVGVTYCLPTCVKMAYSHLNGVSPMLMEGYKLMHMNLEN